MSMTPERFRTAIANLDDADLAQIITALGRSRTTAMEQTVRARIPECSNFGAIAQDLDFALSCIEGGVDASDGCPTKSSLLANIAKEKGYDIQNIEMAQVGAGDLAGVPVIEGDQV